MFKHVIIVQMAVFGMGAQEVVMQGIINFCFGFGTAVLVRQDAQHAMVISSPRASFLADEQISVYFIQLPHNWDL